MTKIQRATPALIILLFGVILLFVFIPNNIQVLEGDFVNARFFPYILAISIIVFSGIDFVTLLKASPSPDNQKINAKTEQANNHLARYCRVVLAFLCCVLWTAVVSYVGYIVTTLFTLALLMLIFGNKSWKQISLTSIIFTILSFYIFANILNVSLPQGIIL